MILVKMNKNYAQIYVQFRIFRFIRKLNEKKLHNAGEMWYNKNY